MARLRQDAVSAGALTTGGYPIGQVHFGDGAIRPVLWLQRPVQWRSARLCRGHVVGAQGAVEDHLVWDDIAGVTRLESCLW